MKRGKTLLIIVFIIMAMACTHSVTKSSVHSLIYLEGTDEFQNESLSIDNKESNEMKIGETKTLSISTNSEIIDGIITFESSNPEIASVDTDGKITALNEGETTITVRLNNLQDSMIINVKKEQVNDNNYQIEQAFTKSSGPVFEPSVINYQTHIQDIGWQDYKKNGEMSGTSGQSKRLEAINIYLDNYSYFGDIEYQTHIQDIGWQDYKKNGEMSGTSGQSKRLEAIKIKLTGDISNYYDVYYRVHVQEFGWLGWAKNDEPAGSSGYGYRLEAIEIKLISKGESIDQGAKAYYHEEIEYQTHIQDIGWQDVKSDGETSGTSGESKRLEAIKVELNEQEYLGNVRYRSHIEDYGWESQWKMNGMMSGTSGESKRLEAIQIELTDEMKENYDIYYRVHCQEFGWLGWAKNGENAGTSGYGYRLEAIQILLREKWLEPLYSSVEAYLNRKIAYTSQIQDVGWTDYSYDGNQTGTIGQSKRLETYKIILINPEYSGNVEYRSYIQGQGWENNWKINGEESGTVGQGKKLEAIQIRLTDQMSTYFDVIYRVHVQNLGMLGWAKNGENAGTSGFSYRIEAIEIKLLLKDSPYDNTQKSYVLNTDGYYVIASALDNNKVLDAYGEYTTNGSNIILHDRINSLAQIWKLSQSNVDSFRISSSMNPNVFVSSQNNNVELHSGNNTDNQLWILEEVDGQYYYLKSRIDGLYITAENTDVTNGTNALMMSKNMSNAQKFMLISYDGKRIYKGLDISDHQGVIDWRAVQTSTNFAILRVGFGNDEPGQDDSQLLNNIRGCEDNNIPYGIYIYSYALNVDEARSEAQHVLRLLQNTQNNFRLGVWFDMEDADGYKARRGITTANGQLLSDICDTFGSIIQNNGYQVGIYASLSWLNGPLNDSRLDKYQKWVAHWNGPVTYSEAINHSTSYSKPYKLWQFCSDGHIIGVGGGVSNVDLDLGYNIFD